MIEINRQEKIIQEIEVQCEIGKFDIEGFKERFRSEVSERKSNFSSNIAAEMK